MRSSRSSKLSSVSFASKKMPSRPCRSQSDHLVRCLTRHNALKPNLGSIGAAPSSLRNAFPFSDAGMTKNTHQQGIAAVGRPHLKAIALALPRPCQPRLVLRYALKRAWGKIIRQLREQNRSIVGRINFQPFVSCVLHCTLTKNVCEFGRRHSSSLCEKTVIELRMRSRGITSLLSPI